MITLKDKFQRLITAYRLDWEFCEEAKTFADTHAEESVQVALNNLAKTKNSGWIYLLLSEFRDIIDRGVFEYCLKNLDDPAFALEVYKNLVNLTDADDTILESKFMKQLPEVAKQLRSGAITRQKKSKKD